MNKNYFEVSDSIKVNNQKHHWLYFFQSLEENQPGEILTLTPYEIGQELGGN